MMRKLKHSDGMIYGGVQLYARFQIWAFGDL